MLTKFGCYTISLALAALALAPGVSAASRRALTRPSIANRNVPPHARFGKNQNATDAQEKEDGTADLGNASDDYEWLSCAEFMNHISTLTKYLHIRSPRKLPRYTKKGCGQLFGIYKKKAPKRIDLIVNLSNHIRKGRRIHPDEPMENYAERRRRRHRNLMDPSGCDGVGGAVYKMSNPGPSAATLAHPIKDNDMCPDFTCPTAVIGRGMQPKTCIPRQFEPDYEESGGAQVSFDAFEEFEPGYGGGGGYRAYTASIVNSNENNDDPFWKGCDQDRVGNYDNLANEFKVYNDIQISVLANDITCEFIDAGFEIGFFGVAVVFPNPVKIACVFVLTALRITELTLETIQDQINFQNGLVDGAEIQAGYYHSINLLDKQCSSFFEAVCRCSASGLVGAPGVGCDGLDSNCDGVPDDCEEDEWPPEIDDTSVKAACSSGQWFEDANEAISCVANSVFVSDDCNEIKASNVDTGHVSDMSCDSSTLIIFVSDGCDNDASTIVPVQVDDGLPPTVSCSVGPDAQDMLVFGPGNKFGHFADVNFEYSASDGCGVQDVRVDVYSNEFERDEQAILYKMDNDEYKLFLEPANCGNGFCVQDPSLEGIRLYSIIVTATDNVRKETSAECFVKVIQQNKDDKIPITDSTQRFPILSWHP